VSEDPEEDWGFWTPDRTWEAFRKPLSLPFRVAFRIRTYGHERLPRSGPAVLAANHIAAMDPLLLAAVTPRPIRYMAKIELLEMNRTLGTFLRHGGVFSVRRGEGDRDALRLARRVLQDGNLLGMFVEGTRQETEEIGPVHPGATMIAMAEGAPVIPVVVQGSIYLKEQLWHPVTVVVGEAMQPPEARGRGALAAFTEEVRSELVKLQRFAQSAIRAGRPRRALPPGSVGLAG
jgi:1-acyl-sn-glycerol-3-phosphate acyltransferase